MARNVENTGFKYEVWRQVNNQQWNANEDIHNSAMSDCWG